MKKLLTPLLLALALASCAKEPYTFQDALADQIEANGFKRVRVPVDFTKCGDRRLAVPFIAEQNGKAIKGCAIGENIYDFEIILNP